MKISISKVYVKVCNLFIFNIPLNFNRMFEFLKLTSDFIYYG